MATELEQENKQQNESRRFYSTSFGRASAVIGKPTLIPSIKSVVPIEWLEESARQQAIPIDTKSLKPGPVNH